MKTNRVKKITGFTLVEMLVTILVIGVLVALIFAGIGKMTGASKQISCASKLRAIGQANAQWWADHNGQFMPSRLQLYADDNGVRRAPSTMGVMICYYVLDIKDQKAIDKFWCCPGDKRPVDKYQSYGINQRLGGDWASPTTWDGHPNPEYDPSYAYIHAVQKPLSQVIYLIDYVDTDNAGWSSVLTGTRWPMRAGSTKENMPAARVDFSRHNDIANALFLDGHVEPLRFENLVGTGDKYISPKLE